MTRDVYKILLVDNSKDDYIVIRNFLNRAEKTTFELSWIDTYAAGLLAIENNHHDAYLLGLYLDKETDMDLLHQAVQLGYNKPIILLMEARDHEVYCRAMATGACDYLVKDNTWSTALLERSLLHAIECQHFKTCQAQLVSKLAITNQDLKDFTHVISHDLKAPLRGIASLADWFVKDYGECFDAEGQELLALIGVQVRRMSDLIDGVLHYSQAGQVLTSETLVDLQELVEEILVTVCPPPGITISVETTLPTILIERTQIQQVFQHLIYNAIQSMEELVGTIQIEHQDLGNAWQFSVTDTGIGIEERHFDQIFQLFQTLMPPDQSDGIGVGLSITKKIIELYGGHIWVTSQVGHGSTFTFTLPHNSSNEIHE